MMTNKLKWQTSTHNTINTKRSFHILSAATFDDGDPKQALLKIYHLTEAHAPALHIIAHDLFKQAATNESQLELPLDADLLAAPCAHTKLISKDVDELLLKIEAMPPEWTLVQLTSLVPPDATRYNQCIQITVFQCGQEKVKPFTVKVTELANSHLKSYSVMKQLKDIITEINEGYERKRERVGSQFIESYSNYINNLNNTLIQVIKQIQDKWLGAWRALMMGRFVSTDHEDAIEAFLVEIYEQLKISDISQRKREILRNACRAQSFLTSRETKRLIDFCFPTIPKQDVIKLVKNMKQFEEFGKLPRHPIILIVDPTIDEIPWESIDILEIQPVSRMPSLRFTHALYAAHDVTITDGRKVISQDSLRGSIIINPSGNLPRSEKRMEAFRNYWTPKWEALRNKEPSQTQFAHMVKNSDIFVYCGHGDGMQYIKQKEVLAKMRIDAVVMVFGCRSVSLKKECRDEESRGSCLQYTMCCCPCIMGFLWNVYDYKSDEFATNLLSTWIPCTLGKIPWSHIDLMQWKPGDKDINIKDLPNLKEKPTAMNEMCNPDLLSAVRIAQKSMPNIIKYAFVARGIPVRLDYSV